jgi:hypothetical protein
VDENADYVSSLSRVHGTLYLMLFEHKEYEDCGNYLSPALLPFIVAAGLFFSLSLKGKNYR